MDGTAGTGAATVADGGPDGSSMTSAGPGGRTDGGPTTGPGDGTTSGSPACDDPVSWYADADEDGFGSSDDTVEACAAPPGYVDDPTDCDDTDDTVYPGALEPCGGPDKDCDFEAPALCESCLQLLASGNGSDDGLYQLDPDGEAGPLPPQQVQCEQSTDNGGWTLVQRTVWDPALTGVLNTDYATWYGVTIGSPGAGAYRMQGGLWPEFTAQQDLMLRLVPRDAGDGSDCGPMSYLGSGGTLTVTEATAMFTGVQSDVTIINGAELTTTDQGPGSNCVGNGGVPFFYGSCCATCPTFDGQYWNEPHPMASYPDDTADAFGVFADDVCPTTAQRSINETMNYVGLNVMELYLR